MFNGLDTMIGYIIFFFDTNASNSENERAKKFKMATVIRATISTKNKYWIDKHRHYELKHFCLQYPEWKKIYASFDDTSIAISMIERVLSTNLPGDPTGRRAVMKTFYSERIKLIEKIAMETDKYLHKYILKAVTEGLSYTYLKTKLGIPCGKDMYYDRYRRFFWLLSAARN